MRGKRCISYKRMAEIGTLEEKMKRNRDGVLQKNYNRKNVIQGEKDGF